MWYVVDFGIVNEVMFTAFVSTNAQNFGGNNLHFNVIWRQEKNSSVKCYKPKTSLTTLIIN